MDVAHPHMDMYTTLGPKEKKMKKKTCLYFCIYVHNSVAES